MKAEQLNYHGIQEHFIFGDDDTNTSKENVGVINDRVPKTIVSDVDTAAGHLLLDNRSTTMTKN